MLEKMEEKNNEIEKKGQKESGKLAIVRIRGITGIKRDIDKTLNQLRLYRKNYCIVLPNDESNIGMVKKVKDYVTWGEIDEETFDMIAEKKGQEYKDRISDSKGKIKYNRFLTYKGRKIKKFFRLNSPKKGYGNHGIKVPFSSGGALGYRADKINDLIKRMM